MGHQPSLFEPDDNTRQVELADADVVYRPDFISARERESLWAQLMATTCWRETTFRIYGKQVPVPRLIAWYGDAGRRYSYSELALDPQPWTPVLAELRARVEAGTGTGFNSVLLNLYRHGRDSVSWHSDDEAELGPAPVIASVSLGARRTFQMRHRRDPLRRHSLELAGGSLLVMGGTTQRDWQHQVPKTARTQGPRINLTFRAIG